MPCHTCQWECAEVLSCAPPMIARWLVPDELQSSRDKRGLDVKGTCNFGIVGIAEQCLSLPAESISWENLYPPSNNEMNGEFCSRSGEIWPMVVVCVLDRGWQADHTGGRLELINLNDLFKSIKTSRTSADLPDAAGWLIDCYLISESLWLLPGFAACSQTVIVFFVLSGVSVRRACLSPISAQARRGGSVHH